LEELAKENCGKVERFKDWNFQEVNSGLVVDSDFKLIVTRTDAF
jgi:hypothetical protein